MTTQRYIETELGTEKLCIECQEYWPMDDEFWYFENRKTKKQGVVRRAISVCKCCYIPRYKPHRLLSAKNSIERNSYARVAA